MKDLNDPLSLSHISIENIHIMNSSRPDAIESNW